MPVQVGTKISPEPNLVEYANFVKTVQDFELSETNTIINNFGEIKQTKRIFLCPFLPKWMYFHVFKTDIFGSRYHVPNTNMYAYLLVEIIVLVINFSS